MPNKAEKALEHLQNGAKSATTKAVEGAGIAYEALQGTAGAVIGTPMQTPLAELPAVAGPLGGVSMVSNGVDAAKNLMSLGADGLQIGTKVVSELKFKQAKKDPVLQGLIGVRAYCTEMQKLQQAAIIKGNEQLNRLDRLDLAANALLNGQEPNLPDDLTDEELNILQKGEAHEAIQQKRTGLQTQMQQMQAASAQLDQTISAVNSHPRIKDAAFRKLEAKHDVNAHMGQIGRKTVRDMMAAGKSIAATGADALSIASTVAQTVGIGGAIGSTILGGAAAGATIATGALMIGGGSVSAAMNMYEHHQLSKRQDAAHQAAADTLDRAGVDVDLKDGEMLSAAFRRVENQAKSDKTVKKLETARDGLVVVAGAATVLAGTSAVVAVAGAAGYGVGATPGLILTATTGGVAVGAGALAGAAAVGVEIYKYREGKAQKHEVADAKLALEALNIQSEAANAPDRAAAEQISQKMTPKHVQALKGVQESMKKTMEAAKVPAQEIAERMNNQETMSHFAACVLLERDTQGAAEHLAKAAITECQSAFISRAQAGATQLVETDLPTDTPALNGLRKLGMSERELTRTVNAIAHHDTRKQGHQLLANHTGLKMKSATH